MAQGSRQYMPKKAEILVFWFDELEELGKHPEELACRDRGSKTDVLCFACGKLDTQRCHIKARADGGSDEVENLHVLCHGCHSESESLSGLAYWRWFNNKERDHLWNHIGRKYGYKDVEQLMRAVWRVAGVPEAMYCREAIAPYVYREFDDEEITSLALWHVPTLCAGDILRTLEDKTLDEVRELSKKEGLPAYCADALISLLPEIKKQPVS